MKHRNRPGRILGGMFHSIFGWLLVKSVCGLRDLCTGETVLQKAIRQFCNVGLLISNLSSDDGVDGHFAS